MNDALSLITSSPSANEGIRAKFQLDAEIDTSGNNLSAGEKQVLSLLRALVRGSKLLVMDEATSSVDAETDALIQNIVKTEFADVTVSAKSRRVDKGLT